VLFLKRLVGYGLLFILVVQIASLSPYVIRVAIAFFDTNPPLGDPPFVRDGSKLPPDYKAALRRFPDADSCLSPNNGPAPWSTKPAAVILRNFAWSNIHGKAEAEVCLFRALNRLGNVDAAARWFELQGFLVNIRTIKTRRPYVRLDAGWLHWPSGPKFRGRSFLARIIPDIIWATNIESNWNPETGKLLSVGVGYTVE
jgi:hypothetical protein